MAAAPMPPAPPVETLGTAEELIEALRPSATRWSPNAHDWIFRGQRDSTRKLLPSAFRADAWAPFNQPGQPPWDPKDRDTRPYEFTILEQFLARLDRSGLDVPNGSFLPQMFKAGPVQFFSFPLDPAVLIFVALAQHHGVPTRLLDWTRIGLNAAYFAAAGAAKQRDKDGHLSVWALRADFAKWSEDFIPHEMLAYRPKLAVATAPRASNPNMHAQSGLFTESFSANAAPVEDIVRAVSRILIELEHPYPVAAPLQRLDLPCTESPKLLRLLAYEGIDGSTMFPGRDGVVLAMKERALWDR